MKKLILILMSILLVGSVLYAQQDDDYKKHPGYVEFGSFDEFQDAEETVEVFIKGPLLKFVAKAAQKEDPALSRLLLDLVLIKVNVFSIERNQMDKVKTMINEVVKKLDASKWEKMVRVKERDEHVEIFTQFDKNDELIGLVVMSVEEDDEAVFVNIVGKIDPDQLWKLSDKFDIPEIDSIEIEHKDKK